MKKLYVSLYLFVFIALVAMGWAIDSFYKSFDKKRQNDFPESVQIFQSVKNLVEKKSNFNDLPHLFEIENLSENLLPNPLREQILSGELVILNSVEGVSFHQKLSSENLMLSMGPIVIEQQSPVWLRYFLTFLFYLSIAFILLLWLRPLLKDVNVLSVSLKKVSNGFLSTRIDVKSNYLSDLFIDFNQMAQTLEILNENNQLFSQAVSHDIRTPLSRILFALEELDNPNDNKVSQLTLSISQDVSKIESLTKELLQYSRLEAVKPNKQTLDLQLFLDQVVAGFDHYNIKINVMFDKPLSPVDIDTDLLQKVINNLLSNAVRFANEKINVSLDTKNNNLTLIIEDDGQGIDFKNKKKEEICQPFVQKHRDDKHFGLGLAIVLRSVNLMKGDFLIDNQSNLGGARFSVNIPL